MPTPRRIRNTPSRSTLLPRRNSARPGMGGVNLPQRNNPLKQYFQNNVNPLLYKTSSSQSVAGGGGGGGGGGGTTTKTGGGGNGFWAGNQQTPITEDMGVMAALKALGLDQGIMPKGGFGFNNTQQDAILQELMQLQAGLNGENTPNYDWNKNYGVAGNIRNWERQAGVKGGIQPLGLSQDQRQMFANAVTPQHWQAGQGGGGQPQQQHTNPGQSPPWNPQSGFGPMPGRGDLGGASGGWNGGGKPPGWKGDHPPQPTDGGWPGPRPFGEAGQIPYGQFPGQYSPGNKHDMYANQQYPPGFDPYATDNAGWVSGGFGGRPYGGQGQQVPFPGQYSPGNMHQGGYGQMQAPGGMPYNTGFTGINPMQPQGGMPPFSPGSTQARTSQQSAYGGAAAAPPPAGAAPPPAAAPPAAPQGHPGQSPGPYFQFNPAQLDPFQNSISKAYGALPQPPPYLTGEGLRQWQAAMGQLNTNLAGLGAQYNQLAPQYNYAGQQLMTNYDIDRTGLAGNLANRNIFEGGLATQQFQNQVGDYNRQAYALGQQAQGSAADLINQAATSMGLTNEQLLSLIDQMAQQQSQNPNAPYPEPKHKKQDNKDNKKGGKG